MTDITQEFAMSMYASTADRNAAMLAEIERLRAEVAGLREALSLAYGYLWCINEEPGTPEPVYPAMQGAYEARKILRGLLTTEQRSKGIGAARAERKGTT